MDESALWGCGLPLLVAPKTDHSVVIPDGTGVVFSSADTKKSPLWGICLSELVAAKTDDNPLLRKCACVVVTSTYNGKTAQ
jgi:hypothetical protein